MARRSILILLAAFIFWGCSNGSKDNASDASAKNDTDINNDSNETKQTPYDTEPIIYDKVYAHSAGTLYQVDPNTLEMSVVGDFIWPDGATDEQMTDIALDEHGKMVGISYFNLYAVDKETCECTLLSPLESNFNGLSFVGGAMDTKETVVATSTGGDWFTLDSATGAGTRIGAFGNDMTSSGDIVFIKDGGTFATAKHENYETDLLVQVDPQTGEATLIGETGFSNIWGIGYWAGQIYGFTKQGEFILIDSETGVGSLEETLDAEFWGAGVTTLAPVVV